MGRYCTGGIPLLLGQADSLAPFQSFNTGKMWADSGRYDSAAKYHKLATQQYQTWRRNMEIRCLWQRYLKAYGQWATQLQRLGKKHLESNRPVTICYETCSTSYWER